MGLTANGIVRRVAIALAVAVALALVVRFATDPDDPLASQSTAARDAGGTHLVGAADFRGIGPSSPGAVVLRWWQANQFGGSTRRIASFYAADSRPELAALRADRKLTEYIFDSTKPRVLDQRLEGSTAQVLTLLPTPAEAGTGEGKPYAFKLRRQNDGWKLADAFIAQRATAERDAKREQARK
jgi:hypothetical protein